MSKTIIEEGSPVTPEFLNSLNSPSFSESPENDGETDYPGISDPFRLLPENNLINPAMSISDESVSNTIVDLSSNTASRILTAGLRVSSETTFPGDLGFICDDPTVGSSFQTVNSTSFSSGEIVGFYFDEKYVKSNTIYGLRTLGSTTKKFRVTLQASFENIGSTGSMQAKISLPLAEQYITSEDFTLLLDNSEKTIAPGETAFLQIVLECTLDDSFNLETIFTPEFNFTCTVAGECSIAFKNFGLFWGDFSGVNIPILSGNSSSEVASLEAVFAKQEIGSRYESGSFKALVPSFFDATGATTTLRTFEVFVPFVSPKLNNSYNSEITDTAITGYKISSADTTLDSFYTITDITKYKNGMVVTMRGDENVYPADIDSAANYELFFNWEVSI